MTAAMECLEIPEEFGFIVEIVTDAEGEAVYLGTCTGYVVKYTVDGHEPGRPATLKLEAQWRVGQDSIRRMLLTKSGGILLVATVDEQLWAIREDKAAAWPVKVVPLDRPAADDDEEEEEEEEEGGEKKGDGLGMVNCMTWDPERRHLFVGNDDGDVIWAELTEDLRTLQILHRFDHHDDMISCMELIGPKRLLLAGSGDGSFSVINLRKKNKVLARSKTFEEEITCMAVMPETKHVVFGTGMGDLKIFKWNYWGLPCEALPPHHHKTESISELVVLDREKSFWLTLAADGVVRIVSGRPLRGAKRLSAFEGQAFEKLACLNHPHGGGSTIFALPACESRVFLYFLDTEALDPKSLLAPDDDADSSSPDDDDDNNDSARGDHSMQTSRGPTKEASPKAKRQKKISTTTNFFNDLD